MSTPYISEIKIFSFNYAPKGWAQCNGQLLPINQNQALFSLLGTTYGGNGQTTFALPDLRGRTPIHMGNSFSEGQVGGQEFHILTSTEMPAHNHQVVVSTNNADMESPAGNLLAKGGSDALFTASQNGTQMSANFIANAGGSQPHSNMQPYLTLNICIALQGIFPSRN